MEKSKEEVTYKFEFTEAEINTIMGGLGELKAVLSVELINKINTQYIALKQAESKKKE